MDAESLAQLLGEVQRGECSADEAVQRIARLPFADLGHSRIDHHRELRNGMAEAIYGPGKSPGATADIVVELLTSGTGPVVLTRASDEQIEAVDEAAPGGERVGRTIVWRAAPLRPDRRVVVASGGTADQPVVDEAAATLRAHGYEPRVLTDVGVAGLHRLLAELDTIESADVVIVVAGMEGALASVVTGLVAAPVIAVPTSTGYGAGFEGVTALLGMLAACASGLTVVGIDNGFGAAAAAIRMLHIAQSTPDGGV